MLPGSGFFFPKGDCYFFFPVLTPVIDLNRDRPFVASPALGQFFLQLCCGLHRIIIDLCNDTASFQSCLFCRRPGRYLCNIDSFRHAIIRILARYISSCDPQVSLVFLGYLLLVHQLCQDRFCRLLPDEKPDHRKSEISATHDPKEIPDFYKSH